MSETEVAWMEAAQPELSSTQKAEAARVAAAADVAAKLNMRFIGGHASGDLTQAGVLVHSFDAFDKGTTHPAWLPCDQSEWCAAFADRFSASLMSRKLPFVFDARQGAFAISPMVADALLCAFAGDGASMDRICRFGECTGVQGCCVQGCIVPGDKHGRDEWCEELEHPWNRSPRCPWQPDHLQRMLEQHEFETTSGKRGREHTCGQPDCGYNELVFEARGWIYHLPHSIEAVLLPAGASAEMAARAHRVHAELLQTFAREYERRAPPPLLLLDIDAVTPFRVPPEAPYEPSPPAASEHAELVGGVWTAREVTTLRAPLAGGSAVGPVSDAVAHWPHAGWVVSHNQHAAPTVDDAGTLKARVAWAAPPRDRSVCP